MRRTPAVPLVPESSEPVGLVIADGGLGDHIPRFWAFVWGPVPDDAFDHAGDAVAVDTFEAAGRSAAGPPRHRASGAVLATCP